MNSPTPRIPCPRCGMRVAATEERCPRCAAPLTSLSLVSPGLSCGSSSAAAGCGGCALCPSAKASAHPLLNLQRLPRLRRRGAGA